MSADPSASTRLVDVLTPTKLTRIARCLDALDDCQDAIAHQLGVAPFADRQMQRDLRLIAGRVQRGELT